MDEITRQVPEGLGVLVERLQAHPYGRYALAQVRDIGAAGATGWAGSVLAVIMRSVTRSLGYAALTFFIALYLAAQPERYRRLCFRLVPPGYRVRFKRLFEETANILERWLLGQLMVMATIGVLSGIGLWALGIEAAFALGLVGGLLTFIPYVGAVLAAVPATLVALTQGPSYALAVVGMYVGVHFVEGNFITPLVQAEATSLPPVLSLLSIVAFSILFGPTVVPLAIPLTLFLIVAVEVLYVEPGLGEPASLPGSPASRDPVQHELDSTE
jgi:predicted PurR-regulated permease PerM